MSKLMDGMLMPLAAASMLVAVVATAQDFGIRTALQHTIGGESNVVVEVNEVTLSNKVAAISAKFANDSVTSHSLAVTNHVSDMERINWNLALSWGNHAGLYKALGWQPDWSDVLNKPALPTAQQIADWDTAAGWGPHATAGYLKSATDTVARASIAALETGKVSRLEWEAGNDAFAGSIGVLATRRVERVWSADGTRYLDATGVEWQLATVTNYTVALSSDFLRLPDGVRPVWSINDWPYTDGIWVGEVFEENAVFYCTSGGGVWSCAIGEYPLTLLPVETAQGTAVVSQHIATIYLPYRVFADTNQTDKTEADLANHVATNAASVIAQAQPSVLVRYGDLATTNTAGYAAFTNLNPASRYISVFQPTVGQSLAKARWDVASTLAGTLSVSAYAGSAFSSNAVYAVLTLYTAGGAVVASNIGATVGVDRVAVSNISATVTLSAPATNGYVVAEIFSAMAASNYVYVRSGGSYPFTLSTLNSPLGYLTLAQATALFALKDNGVQVNPTMGGNVTLEGSLTLGGTTYETLPAVPTVEDVANWNSAFGWGDHAGLYRAANWTPDWTDVQNKPAVVTSSTITVIWWGTKAEYQAINPKLSTTLYVTEEE